MIGSKEVGYIISTDKSRLNVDLIHQYLSQESYWAQNIPRALVERSIEHSLCFGVYWHEQQVGFARVISDFATFAYLADVFILPDHRGQGLSKRLVAAIAAHPDLQGLRRFMLATRDAHSLYAQFGFTAIDKPDLFMQRKLIERY
ncbi:GNAT family N-acetyltransferase [Spirosoma luteolum]